ncbi:MAG: nucleoside deaminase, partial [Bacilli bacterium]|nr:nucleoside deaminase [Bacilli bacterium]
EAIKEAEKTLGNWRLDGATLYVTLEPCLMCSGAILQSRISKVVFGSRDEKDGAIVSNYFVFDSPCSHERPLVFGEVLKDECDALLKNFFASKRN